MDTNYCKNCKKLLLGKYCVACGEKVVEAKDFHLKTLFAQAIDGIFNLDSKLFKSFKYLLFKPGILTLNYVEGIRKPFMKPFQLFLVTNVLFFLLLTQADILRIPAKYYFNHERVETLKTKSEETKVSELEIRQTYDNLSSDLSKGAVIILIPILAVALLILNIRTNTSYGMHMIFSMHFVSFFFLSCLLSFFVGVFGNRILQLFIISTNLLYVGFAIRKFYQNSYAISFLKSLVFTTVFFGLMILYRQVISDVTFNFLI